MSTDKKKGFTQMPHWLEDKLISYRGMSPDERGVFDLIVRYTIGFNREKDPIALSLFEKLTGMKRSHACRALKTIELKKVILIEKDIHGGCNIYSINSNTEEWIKKLPEITRPGRSLNESSSLPTRVTAAGVTNTGNEVLPTRVMSVTNTGNECYPCWDISNNTLSNNTLSNNTLSNKHSENSSGLSEIKSPSFLNQEYLNNDEDVTEPEIRETEQMGGHDSSSISIQRLFDYYQYVFRLTDGKLDVSRRKRLKWALDSYGIVKCKLAIDGCAKDRFAVQNGIIKIEQIFKNADSTEINIKKGETNNDSYTIQPNQDPCDDRQAERNSSETGLTVASIPSQTPYRIGNGARSRGYGAETAAARRFREHNEWLDGKIAESAATSAALDAAEADLARRRAEIEAHFARKRADLEAEEAGGKGEEFC